MDLMRGGNTCAGGEPGGGDGGGKTSSSISSAFFDLFRIIFTCNILIILIITPAHIHQPNMNLP